MYLLWLGFGIEGMRQFRKQGSVLGWGFEMCLVGWGSSESRAVC